MAITRARMNFWVCSRNDDFRLTVGSNSTLKVTRNPSTDSYNEVTNNPISDESEYWYCKSFISPDNFFYDENNIFPFGIGYNYYTQQNNPIEINSIIDDSKQFIVDCIGVSSVTNITTNYPNFSLLNAGTNTKYFNLPTQNPWINNAFNQLDTNKFKYWVNELSSIVTPNNALRFYIIGHFEAVSRNFKVIDNLTNCTKDNQQTEIEPNDSYNVTLSSVDGYGFSLNSIPYAIMGNVRYDGVLNENGTVTIIINEVTANVTLYATALRKYEINLNIYNCELYNNDNLYNLNYVIEGETYYFKLKSNDGFVFKTFPTWTMGQESGSFNLSDIDNTIAIIQYNLVDHITINDDLSITANATMSPSLKYGFVSIYNPTYDETDRLSKKRFFSTSEGYEDLSQYIISFRKLYVDIPQTTRELVYFGQRNTNISCNIVTTNFIETDCGTITINEYNENSLDYNGVEINLYLPFIGDISLNANHVYGKELHLVYRTNPLNGDCVAIIYSDNKQVAYSQGNVSFEVPINFKNGNLNNFGTSDNSLYMAELTPYIEIKTNRQYQNMNDRLLNNNVWNQLLSFSGYCAFSDIDLNMGDMTQSEYDEIISILKSGVVL